MTIDEKKQPEYWVYLLACADETYYIGMTNNLKQRYKQHCTQTAGCKYTRRRDKHPLRMAAWWQLKGGKGAAISLEITLKKLKASDKRILDQDARNVHLLLQKLGAAQRYEIIDFGNV